MPQPGSLLPAVQLPMPRSRGPLVAEAVRPDVRSLEAVDADVLQSKAPDIGQLSSNEVAMSERTRAANICKAVERNPFPHGDWAASTVRDGCVNR
eukprot:CAMPEP_0182837476 /NCGR_PEP_ID=MMETSP0006_2-20121128/22733_1 /TAXON_ID=97485 /ORGANISM="Prymnesium parvum, Strain Texoma1" /LENGTH=94 /DNA_ID=CAMNT_0024966321 /DNA_START=426 /DNA_END=711 /DNA_ORIENTATION=+